ncbi:hypothetical protein Pmani_020424 [Petrolisthes manimaculis]|uniref:Uncharacterized protein n=1 Tax=Petrolisthes manimaculis TaxID=1843537 RepID=A0AAE1PIG7_9EUCA|nr:hypothetical protein Pmani_020424 [Petrolisthes manimaculis]
MRLVPLGDTRTQNIMKLLEGDQYPSPSVALSLPTSLPRGLVSPTPSPPPAGALVSLVNERGCFIRFCLRPTLLQVRQEVKKERGIPQKVLAVSELWEVPMMLCCLKT